MLYKSIAEFNSVILTFCINLLRETILRLVSESKKHEKSTSELLELRQTKDQLQSSMKSFEKERGDLYQRMAASQETLTAQEKELQAKERR
jgi:septal ring factor EnvC (AmiA/AmiB activator)